MNILSRRSLSALIAGSALIGSFALAGTAFAAGPGGQKVPRPAVVGTVASVSGTTLTVTARGWQRASTTPATMTYTVDAANATVTKNGASSTVSAIAVGDTVMVRGTKNGTNMIASVINDGNALGRPGMMLRKNDTDAPHMLAIAGNGQPVVGGIVTAITGSTLTITNKSNVTYTVTTASTTAVSKAGVTGATPASIVVGDNIVVQGTVNGTSVTASSVIDQGVRPIAPNDSESAPHKGFMGAIGGFFAHLFGF